LALDMDHASILFTFIECCEETSVVLPFGARLWTDCSSVQKAETLFYGECESENENSTENSTLTFDLFKDNEINIPDGCGA
jgi:hypothetical protein